MHNLKRLGYRGKTYYSDYVGHMVRLFLNHKDGIKVQESTKADVSNWVSVQTIWNMTSEEVRKMLEDMYLGDVPFDVAVHDFSLSHNKDENIMWKEFKTFTKRVATLRGLI